MACTALQDVAQIFQVSAMPTFVFLRNAQKIGMVRGANRQALESMLQQHASAAGGPAGSGGLAAALQAAVAGGSGGASAPAAEQAPAEPPTALLPGLLPGHVSASIASVSLCSAGTGIPNLSFSVGRWVNNFVRTASHAFARGILWSSISAGSGAPPVVIRACMLCLSSG